MSSFPPVPITFSISLKTSSRMIPPFTKTSPSLIPRNTTLTDVTLPSCEKSTVSKLPPPMNVSLPSPDNNVSLPSPPSSVSSPPSPSRVSAPSPPSMILIPPSPMMVSTKVEPRIFWILSNVSLLPSPSILTIAFPPPSSKSATIPLVWASV